MRWIGIFTEDNHPYRSEEGIECNCFGVTVKASDKDEATEKLSAFIDLLHEWQYVDIILLETLGQWQDNYATWVYYPTPLKSL